MEDSIALARQIIDVWASDRIYLAIAEEQLSKACEIARQGELTLEEMTELLELMYGGINNA